VNALKRTTECIPILKYAFNARDLWQIEGRPLLAPCESLKKAKVEQLLKSSLDVISYLSVNYLQQLLQPNKKTRSGGPCVRDDGRDEAIPIINNFLANVEEAQYSVRFENQKAKNPFGDTTGDKKAVVDDSGGPSSVVPQHKKLYNQDGVKRGILKYEAGRHPSNYFSLDNSCYNCAVCGHDCVTVSVRCV
jgi:hypothetical protein